MPGKKKRALKNKEKKNQSEQRTAGTEDKFEEDSVQYDEPAQSTADVRCEHLKRSINAASIRKRMKNHSRILCEDCEKINFIEPNDVIVWMCLFCGYKGCDRYSTHQHALKHTETSRSGPHHVAVSLETYQIWCYQCDNEVMPALSIMKNLLSDIKRTLVKISTTHKTTNSAENIVAESEQFEKPLSTAKIRKGPRDQQLLNSHIPLKGLKNLGNTCFFNSVVQNLMQTHHLEQLLLDGSMVKGASFILDPNINSAFNEKTTTDDIIRLPSTESSNNGLHNKKYEPIKITLDSDYGPLTLALRALYEEFKEQRVSIIAPSSLFGEVCRRASRFQGFQQQDSHELLRYLLDSLKIEELRRRRMALLKAFNLIPANPNNMSSTQKNVLKAYDRSSNFTCVEQVFGGELVQCIKCLRCNNVSVRFESFLDLSLPVADNVSGKTATSLTKQAYSNSPVSNYSLKKAKKAARKQAKEHHAAIGKQKSSKISHEGQDDSVKDLGHHPLLDILEAQDSNAAGNLRPESPSQLVEKIESLSLNDCGQMGSPNGEVEQHESAEQKVEPNGECHPESDCTVAPDNCTLDENGFYNDSENGDDSSLENDLWSLYTEPLENQATVPKNGCHLLSCLAEFMSTEILDGKNKFGCERCNGHTKMNSADPAIDSDKPKIFTEALKRYMIFSPPAVLTLHLKRFQQAGGSLRKISKHVDFPLLLDISAFCCRAAKRKSFAAQRQILYSLYGVVCHSGRLSGGHYVAYVKLRSKNANLNVFLQTLRSKSDIVGSAIIKGLAATRCDISNGSSDKTNECSLAESVVDSKPGEIEKAAFRPEDDDKKADVTSQNESDAVAADDDKWYYISDSYVDEVNVNKVMSSEAYLLFYERIV